MMSDIIEADMLEESVTKTQQQPSICLQTHFELAEHLHSFDPLLTLGEGRNKGRISNNVWTDPGFFHFLKNLEGLLPLMSFFTR